MNKLHRILLATLCAWGVPLCSRAGYGFFANGGTYVVLNVDGAGSTYYHLSPTSGGNPTFNNANFGTFQLSVDTFVLKGFENNTYENSNDGIMNGNLNYRVYPFGSPSGSYVTMNHNGFTDLTGGNERHFRNDANVNLLAGLSPGVYSLEVYTWAQADWNISGGPGDGSPNDTIYPDNTATPDATRYVSSSESAYLFRSDFTVTAAPVASAIPEPGTAVFAVFGTIALRFLTRKRR